MTLMYSSYYEQSFTEADIDEALDYYNAWCQENGQEPEVDVNAGAEQFEDDEPALSHMLYHAELKGWKPDAE